MGGRGWWMGGVAVLLLGLVLTACSQKEQGTATSSTQQTEKDFSLNPNKTAVKVDFLEGQLRDLRVSERVEQNGGKVVAPPMLHATLTLKNVSTDQTARLISGKLEYLGPDGKPMLPAEGRRDTGFSFEGYQTDRLDPGKETSQDIEVPFPKAALEGRALRDVQLDLTFAPAPYKVQSVTVPVSVSG